MHSTTIVVYGADWCGDCRRAKRFLNQLGIPFEWIDIESDRKAEEFVMDVNRGMRSIPTIVFEDGSILVEPTDDELAEKIGMRV
jgi:glutaredoxin-like protein